MKFCTAEFARVSHEERRREAIALRRVDFRYLIAYHNRVMSQPSPPGKIIFLGACLIAAVRLAREERWDNSPRVVARIADAIDLAERIYKRMSRDGHFISQ